MQIAQSADRRSAWKALNNDIAADKLKMTHSLIQIGVWADANANSRAL